MKLATWNGYVGQSPANYCDGVRQIVEREQRPLGIFLQEGSRGFRPLHRLADRLDYELIYRKGMGVETRSTLMLVDGHADIVRTGGLMMETDWKGPKMGLRHPGRVFPTAVVNGPGGRTRFLDVHLPPGMIKNRAAVKDSLDLIEKRAMRWCDQLVIMGDWNLSYRLRGPISAHRVAKHIGGRIVHGDARIDYAIVRGFRNARYQSKAKLGSDTHRYGVLTVSN